MSNYDLFKELGEILKPDLTLNNNTCRNCKHNQAWQCNSKVFHYCEIRKSNKTNNKLLKIKCKDIACNLFEKI